MPAIAKTIGSASQFVYDNGLICFQTEDYVCILETIFGHKFYIPISKLLDDLDYDTLFPPKLLHCSSALLSVLYSDRDALRDYLLVFKINFKDKELKRIHCIPLFSSARIFVRNTEDYLYYGTHSFLGSRNHNEWVVQGLSLHGVPFPTEARHASPERTEKESRCVYLTDFTGSGIGSEVSFRIHENTFYAVTNCDDSDVIEVDFTSCYRCYKFPLDNPRVENVRRHRMYRRQHGEGPLHDSWTNLTLQVDERTNDLVIVEARKEWPEGRSRHSRSFYMTNLVFPDPDEYPGAPPPDVGTAPPNSRFAQLISHRSTYMKSIPRAHWQVHSEERNIFANRHGKSKPPQQFIVAETKFKAYSLSAGTFIDIVDDPSCCNSYADTAKRKSCLRIRTGARHIAPLQLFDSSASKPSPYSSTSRLRSKPAPTRSSCWLLPTDLYDAGPPSPYAYTPVALWPGGGGGKGPSSMSIADGQAHEALNPIDAHGVDVQAASDDRMLVLLLRDGGCGGAAGLSRRGGAGFRGGGGAGGGGGRLVVLSFDAAARIPDDDEEAAGGKAVAASAQEQWKEGRVGAGGAERPAWSGHTTGEEANEVVNEGFRRPRKDVYAPDVLAALARGPDDFDDAGLVDLDLENVALGF